MPKPIPKYAQVFKKEEPKIEDTKILLTEAFKKGGCELEPEYKIKNPNAKRTIPFVTADMRFLSATRAKIGTNQDSMGNWVYCGNTWYVRNIAEGYQFARYLAYDFDARKTVGPWDQARYDKENIKAVKAKSVQQK